MPVPPKEFLGLIQDFVPFNKFLGIAIDEAREGFVRLSLPYRPEYIGDSSRPALHGGVISTLIDTCGGFAVWTQLRIEDRVSTIDLRVDYLAPGAPEALYADGTVVRVGNRVGVVDIRCWQASQPSRTVATGKGVYNIKRMEDSP
ncbi:MAG: PaaI family thioesterase [Polyangia bacterium]